MPTAGPNIGATGFDFKKKTPIVNSGKPTVKKSEPGIGNRGIASHKSSTSGSSKAESTKFLSKLINSGDPTRY